MAERSLRDATGVANARAALFVLLALLVVALILGIATGVLSDKTFTPPPLSFSSTPP